MSRLFEGLAVKSFPVFRNFAIANFFIVLPLMILVGLVVPDRLDVFVQTDSQLSLRTGVRKDDGSVSFDRINQCNGSKSIQRLRVYFGDGFDCERNAIGFGNGPVRFKLHRVSVLHHGFFRYELDLSRIDELFARQGDLTVADSDDVGLIVDMKSPDGYFVPGAQTKGAYSATFGSDYRFIRLLCVGEVILLLLSVMAMFVWHDGRMSFRGRVTDSVFVAVVVSLMFCVLLPIQSFLVNESSFPYSLGDLLPELVVRFFIGSFAITLCLSFTSLSFGRLFHVILFSFAVYEYFETGILASFAPPLNGDFSFFGNARWAYFDMGFMCVVMLLPVVFMRWIGPKIRWCMLGLLVMAMASLLDVKKEKTVGDDAEKPIAECLPILDVAKSVRYSMERNVFVFVVDSVCAGCAADVVGKCPEIRALFEGFVQYRDNLGMGLMTAYGYPGLVTGIYQEPSVSDANYYATVLGEHSFVAPYVHEDVPFYFLPAGGGGYTNRRVIRSDSAEIEGGAVSARRIRENAGMNMFEILRFRMMPFPLKKWTYVMTVNAMPARMGLTYEAALYPILKQAPIDSEKHLVFHSYYTWGSHPPFAFDRDGNQLSSLRTDYDAMFDQTYCVLKQLGELLACYRERGFYDRSFIVICADHGTSVDPAEVRGDPPIPNRSFPVLWVKTFNAKGELKTSHVPSSHSKINELVTKAKSSDLSASDVDSILLTPDRYVRVIKNGVSRDWFMDATGSVTYVESNG